MSVARPSRLRGRRKKPQVGPQVGRVLDTHDLGLGQQGALTDRQPDLQRVALADGLRDRGVDRELEPAGPDVSRRPHAGQARSARVALADDQVFHVALGIDPQMRPALDQPEVRWELDGEEAGLGGIEVAQESRLGNHPGPVAPECEHEGVAPAESLQERILLDQAQPQRGRHEVYDDRAESNDPPVDLGFDESLIVNRWFLRCFDHPVVAARSALLPGRGVRSDRLPATRPRRARPSMADGAARRPGWPVSSGVGLSGDRLEPYPRATRRRAAVTDSGPTPVPHRSRCAGATAGKPPQRAARSPIRCSPAIPVGCRPSELDVTKVPPAPTPRSGC